MIGRMPPDPPDRATPPLPPASLRLGIAYSSAGNILFNACRVGVVILITKFATPAELGRFDASMAWSAPIVTFLMLQLRAACVADTTGRFTFGTYVAARVVGMVVATVALGVLTAFFAARGATPAFLWLFGAVAVGKLIWSTAEVFWAVFQRQERLDRFAVAMGLRGLGMLVPFAIVLPLWPPPRDDAAVLAAVIAYSVLWLALLLGYEVRLVWRSLTPGERAWTWPSVAALVRQTAPLGVVVLLVAATESLPRLVLSELDDKSSLGYFSAIYLAGLPLLLLVIAVGHAATNRAAQLYRQDAAAWRRLVIKLSTGAMGLGALAWLGAALVGDLALAWVYRPDYAQHAAALTIVMASMVLLLPASLFGTFVTAAQAYWIQVPLQLVVVGVTWGVAVWLVPERPVMGAAWAVVARAAAQFVLYGATLVWLLRRRTPLSMAVPPDASGG